MPCFFPRSTYNEGTMVVRMRSTRSHTRNRRSHHAIEVKNLGQDKETGVTHLRHRMCMETGRYKGRKVVDLVSKRTKSKTSQRQGGK